MNSPKNLPLDSQPLALALIGLATLIGGIVRFAAPLASDFPLNDGGLFFAMIQSLQASHYHLPAQFLYNGIQIPFVYPPLGFYFTGLAADLLKQNPLEVIRWLPPLVSTLTIPAFYFLARGLGRSQATSALAPFVFALLPRDFDWLIMGGGVTRAFGFLFALLTLTCAQQLFSAPRPRLIFWTSGWATLTVLAHPEASLQTAIAALLLFLFHRSRPNLTRALLVTALTLLLTSPWWTLSLARHGLDPFLAAASASAGNRSDLVNIVMRFFLFFRFEFTEEAFLPFIAVFGLIGFLAALGKRDWFLPAWLTVSLLIEPRSAPLYISIPLAILTAQTLTEIVMPALERTGSKRLVPIFLGLLLAYSAASAWKVTSTIKREITVTPYDREAMYWIQNSTPPDSVFLVLTDELPLRDPVSEWFPVLTGRISAATVYGHEWIANPTFASRVDAYNSLQACLFQNTDCIQAWSARYGIGFTHILLSKFQNGGRPSPLQIHLEQSHEFRLVYQTPEISIYQK